MPIRIAILAIKQTTVLFAVAVGIVAVGELVNFGLMWNQARRGE